MRVSLVSFALFTAAVLGQDAAHQWQAAGANDLRSPCPLLNSLANHGYLPRTGRNISVDALIEGMHAGLNLRDDAKLFFRLQGNKALTASSTGDAQTFHLSDLITHDLIEHDASLSRADIHFGDNWSFNQTIFDETKSYWPADSLGQTAMYLGLFGDYEDGNARTDWVV